MTTEAPRRSRRHRDDAVLTPLEQIRRPPGSEGVEATGAWAYYLREDGATIREALVLYPNGGVPDIDDLRMRDRYGTNASYYRERQARRGLRYVGQTLNEQAMRDLIAILEANREDEVLDLKEDIEDARDVSKNSDLPEVRSQAKKRIKQLQRRLEMIEAGFDPDELLAELNDIARAQQLAKVDPAVLRVMRSMIGEVNEKMLSYFAQGKPVGDAPARGRRGGGDRGAEFAGKDTIE